MAWLSMAAAATWEVSNSLSRLDALPDTGRPDVEKRKELLLSAARCAIVLWTPQNSIEGHKHTSARNSRILAQLAVEAFQLARNQVRSISCSPKISPAASFWPVVVQRLDAGVAYTRMTDVVELYEHGLDVVERDISLGIKLVLQARDKLAAHRGYLIDNLLLVRYEATPSGQRPQGGDMTSDKYAIRRFAQRFQQLSHQAVPAQVAIAELRPRGQAIIARAAPLGHDAEAWMEERIRLGKFSAIAREKRWTPDHEAAVIEKLRNRGLLYETEDGLLLPAWGSPESVFEAAMRRCG
jgi:hypothetical protein